MAYEVNVTGSPDETYKLVIEIKSADGTDFPWSDASFTYAVRGDCGPSFTVRQGDAAMTVSPPHLIISKPARTLRPGAYCHDLNVTYTSTGDVVRFFDGEIMITEDC